MTAVSDTAPITRGGSDAARDDGERLRVVLTSVLVTAIFAWVVLPRFLQSLLAPKFRSRVGEAGPEASGVAGLAQLALLLAVAGICVWVVIRMSRDQRRLPILGLAVLVAPWLYLVGRDLMESEPPTYPALLFPLVVLAFWVLRPSVRTFGLVGYLVGGCAVLSLLLAVVLPAKGLFITSSGELVTEDKELLPFGILVGFLTHGNNLGQFLAMGVPLVFAIPRRSHRYLLLGPTLVALLWTASRSSILAVAVGGVAAVLFLVVPRAVRGLVVVPVVAAVVGLVCVLPLVTEDPGAFTNRGLIWRQSIEWWRADEWFGLGAGWYGEIGRTSSRIAATVFHGHNQFVQLLVTGGVVLVALTTVLVWLLTARVTAMARNGSVVGAVYLVTMLGTSVLEKSFVFVDNASMFALFVIPVCIIAFAPVPGAPPDGAIDGATGGDDLPARRSTISGGGRVRYVRTTR